LLNLPAYSFKLKVKGGKEHIFDNFRQKWVVLTPEEWVRQHFIRYLIEEKHYPDSLISVEQTIRFNQMNFRSDAVIYSRTGRPLVIIECKAPDIKISQQAFDQIVRYNFDLKVNYLIVTNGMNHYCCKIDENSFTYAFLTEIPDYNEL
jgi:hypothetical protein